MMLKPFLLLSLTAATQACGLRKFENLVTFGDSFTDDTQSQYLLENEGEPPAPGTKLPYTNHTASGGYAWGRLVAQETNVSYNNYAVSGAYCTNDINERLVEGVPFPDVMGYQVPLFEADLDFEELYPNRQADNTAYVLNIGGNDLGFSSFFRNQNEEGTDLSTVSDCMMEVFDRVYASGGRHFVLMTTWNIEDTPLYTPIEDGGMEYSRVWPDKADYNTTEEHGKLEVFVHALKDLSGKSVELGVLKNRWAGASFTFFDLHALFKDIMKTPEEYFVEPADIKNVWQFCETDEDWENKTCEQEEADLKGFMWFDYVHPSERTSEIVAEKFIEVINGDSKYAKYYSS